MHSARAIIQHCPSLAHCRTPVAVVMLIGILAFVCVSHVTLNRTVRKRVEETLLTNLPQPTTLESFWRIDITERNRVLIAIHALRCDLVKVPRKTSGLVDTGASRVALGLFTVFGYGSRSFGFASRVHHF